MGVWWREVSAAPPPLPNRRSRRRYRRPLNWDTVGVLCLGEFDPIRKHQASHCRAVKEMEM